MLHYTMSCRPFLQDLHQTCRIYTLMQECRKSSCLCGAIIIIIVFLIASWLCSVLYMVYTSRSGSRLALPMPTSQLYCHHSHLCIGSGIIIIIIIIILASFPGCLPSNAGEQEEGIKKQLQAKSNKQQGRATHAAHPRPSLFQRRYQLTWVGFEPTPLHTPDRALYQLSYRSMTLYNTYIFHTPALPCLYYNYLYCMPWLCCVALLCCNNCLYSLLTLI